MQYVCYRKKYIRCAMGSGARIFALKVTLHSVRLLLGSRGGAENAGRENG